MDNMNDVIALQMGRMLMEILHLQQQVDTLGKDKKPEVELKT